MADANQVLGIVEIFIDGQYYPSLDGATLTFSNVTRDAVIGDRMHGYTQKAAASKIECRFAPLGAVTLADLDDITSSSIIFAGDNGHTYTLRNAFRSDAITLKSGEIAATFLGEAVEEQ
jgi:hypothetical protein